MASLLARINALEKKRTVARKPPPLELQIEIKRLEESYYAFIQAAWHLYQPQVPFRHGKHLEAITELVEELYHGRVSKAGVNIPPGFGKSSTMSVFLVPWVWATRPGDKFLFTSGSYDLTIRDSVFARDIMTSEWYQKRWGHKFQLKKDSNAKDRFSNNQGGTRITGTVGSKITGERTNWSIIDDPNNAIEMESEAHIHTVNTWADRGLSTRLDITGVAQRTLLVQQRFDARDLTGHWLSKNDPDFVHFYLPMEFVPHKRCVTVPTKSTNGKAWQDWREHKGELLWPDVVNAEALAKMKLALGSEYAIAGQLQQIPSPEGGGIIDISKFKMWRRIELPAIEYIIQSWDTAILDELESKKDTSYSAMTTWGIFKGPNDDGELQTNVVLLNMWKGRVEFPDLKKIIKAFSYDIFAGNKQRGPKPNEVIIEAKASGKPIVQELRRNGVHHLVEFNPNQIGMKYPSKTARCRMITPYIIEGAVYLLSKESNIDQYSHMSQTFLDECEAFPKGASDDVVDTFSQAMHYLRLKRKIHEPTDPVKLVRPDFSHYPRV